MIENELARMHEKFHEIFQGKKFKIAGEGGLVGDYLFMKLNWIKLREDISCGSIN